MGKLSLVVMYDGARANNKNKLFLIDGNKNVKDVTFDVYKAVKDMIGRHPELGEINSDFKTTLRYNNNDGTCNFSVYSKILHIAGASKGGRGFYEIFEDIDLDFDLRGINLQFVKFTDLKLNKYRGVDDVIVSYVDKKYYSR